MFPTLSLVSHKKKCSLALMPATTWLRCAHTRAPHPALHRTAANESVSNPRRLHAGLVGRLSSLSINRFGKIMLDASWLIIVILTLLKFDMDGTTPFEESFPDYSQQPLPSLNSTLLQGKNQDNLNVHSIQVMNTYCKCSDVSCGSVQHLLELLEHGGTISGFCSCFHFYLFKQIVFSGSL